MTTEKITESTAVSKVAERECKGKESRRPAEKERYAPPEGEKT